MLLLSNGFGTNPFSDPKSDFRRCSLCWLWLDRWKRNKTSEQIRNAMEEVLLPLALNEVSYPIDSVFQMDDFSLALARNSESRFGKVLLARDKSDLEKSMN